MKNRPTVSVIMSTYKEPCEYLKLSIESILCQTFGDFEFLIAIDDPYNEQHIQIVNEYANLDNRIIWYVNEKNLGLPRSLNNLISKARGKYIARMDSDDVSLPQRFEKQVQVMESNINVSVLGTLAYKMKENGIIYGVLNLPTNQKCIKSYIENGIMPTCHPSWMVRAEVYKMLKGYREIPYAEDFDFILRAYKNGYEITNLSEPLLKYRIHSHKQKISHSKAFNQYLNAKYSYLQFKHGEFSVSTCNDSSLTIHLRKFRERLYNIANNFFTKNMGYKSQRKVFLGLLLFLLSFISPDRAEFNVRLLRAKFFCKLKH